ARDYGDRDPRPLEEFCRDDDDESRARCRRSEQVDGKACAMPVSLAGACRRTELAPPMYHHAELRHREGEKSADRKKRDQSVCDPPESEQQQPGSDSEE